MKTGKEKSTHSTTRYTQLVRKGRRIRPLTRTKKQKEDTLVLMRLVTSQKSKKLDNFALRNKDIRRTNYKVYHLLGDSYTFINAYAKVSKNKGSTTKGIKKDESYISLFSAKKALKMAHEFRRGTYSFEPARRKMIPKPGKKSMRPIDTPTQKDRIVQEALRGILEAVYEPEFRQFERHNGYTATNYGFRPDKSCMDALLNLKRAGQKCVYAIEGDIVGAYNNVNHDILISLISRRIRDKRFLHLIRQLLKAGIMEKNKQVHSLKGTPQGSIVSPILFNIVMFELDKFMYKEFVVQGPEESPPKRNPKWVNAGYKMKTLNKQIRKLQEDTELDKNLKKAQIKELKKAVKEIRQTRLITPSYVISTLPRAAVYARYADDWVLLLNKPHGELANDLKKIKNFLWELGLELDSEKTLITKLTDGVSFLGYSLKMTHPKAIRHKRQLIRSKVHGVEKVTRGMRRTNSRKIRIEPDKKRILRNLRLKGMIQGPDAFPIGVRSLAIMEPYQIVERYRMMMLGLANYYRLCDGHYILNRVSYILQYSCAKTLSTRYKCTMKQVFAKHGNNLTVEREVYNPFAKNEKAKVKKRTVFFPTYTYLKHSGWIDREQKERHSSLEGLDPFNLTYYNRTKFKLFSCCVICGSDDRVENHHINSLRSIPLKKRKKFDYLRQRLNRLQIPVCHKCHQEVTHGRYHREISPTTFYDEWMAKL